MIPAENEALQVKNQTRSKPRILIADDDKSIRDSLAMVLQINGFDVVTAADVNEALSQIGS
jgi:DNA-binding response OmpR family regulator